MFNMPDLVDAAKAGDGDAYAMLLFIYGTPHFGSENADELLKWLEEFVNNRDDGWAKIVLGAIYCGVKYKINEGVDFESESGLHINFKKGIKLIEEGLEGKTSKALDCWDYAAIGEAYSNRWNHGIKTGGANIQDMKKAVEYLEKSLELSEEAGGELGESAEIIKTLVAKGEEILSSF